MLYDNINFKYLVNYLLVLILFLCDVNKFKNNILININKKHFKYCSLIMVKFL